MLAVRPLVRCSSLKNHLTENLLQEIKPSPVLVFTSKPTRTTIKPLSEFIFRFESLAKDDLGLADIHSASIASVFPTQKDVEDAQDLIRETGASTVIGVGSGVAMDLVKAIDASTTLEHKLLVPATSAAVFAANTPYSLMLDLEKEILVQESSPKSPKFTSMAQQGTVFPSPDSMTACHSILLDAAHRLPPERIMDLELARWALAFDPYIQGMISTSLQMSATTKGQEEESCNAPLALAASLIPAYFPSATMFRFWAALLPGLASLHETAPKIDRTKVPALSDMGRPTSVETLLGHVQRNPMASDLDMEQLEQILTVSLRV